MLPLKSLNQGDFVGLAEHLHAVMYKVSVYLERRP